MAADAGGRLVRPGAFTLHSSWRGLLSGSLGALALCALSAAAIARNGAQVLAVVIGVVGLVLLAVSLFDLPIASRFTESGIERRMPLRRHRIDWHRVSRLTRTRPGLAKTVVRSALEAGSSHDEPRRRGGGGLVAVVGRRRVLLVDQVESGDEFAELVERLRSWAPELVDETLAPPEGAAPTWLYRRSRWSPDGDRHR